MRLLLSTSTFYLLLWLSLIRFKVCRFDESEASDDLLTFLFIFFLKRYRGYKSWRALMSSCLYCEISKLVSYSLRNEARFRFWLARYDCDALDMLWLRPMKFFEEFPLALLEYLLYLFESSSESYSCGDSFKFKRLSSTIMACFYLVLFI